MRPSLRSLAFPRLVPVIPGFLALLACGPGSPPAPDESGPPPAEARARLPVLFSIMSGLQADMAGLDRGLWLGDLDTVAVHAHGIADHPAIPEREAEFIAAVLGPDMKGFGEMDARTHDLAVRVAEAAETDDLEVVLAAQEELHRSCVACHERFRERLREGLAGSEPSYPRDEGGGRSDQDPASSSRSP